MLFVHTIVDKVKEYADRSLCEQTATTARMMLPHGVQPSSSPTSQSQQRRRFGNGGGFGSSGHGDVLLHRFHQLTGGILTPTKILILATAIPSFFLGTLTSLYSGLSSCSVASGVNIYNGGGGDAPHPAVLESMIQERLLTLKKEWEAEQYAGKALGLNNNYNNNIKCPEGGGGGTDRASVLSQMLPPLTVGKFAAGFARVHKDEFFQMLDMGVPVDPPKEGASDVLILYQKLKTLPDAYVASKELVPVLSMKDAVQRCDYFNVILSDYSPRNQCVAIVPQYESYHIQKWMRITDDTKRGGGVLDSKQPLTLVSRGHQPNGKDQFDPPRLAHTRQNWDMLQNYLTNLEQVLAELKVILERIAIKNTVIVMVCNFGQSELLMNFACSARARHFDTSNIIVFTTDQATTELATSLGLTAYYDERNFGDIPAEAAKRYGDARFVAMMMAKVICVQLVSMLGFDFLFQDVDIVWFKNPLEYFMDPNSPVQNFDIFFQDDGGHSVRYAPYSANSGFYFVRHNDRTRHFLTSLFMSGDLILKTDSHQQALIALLNEHVSLYGLKTKVLSRDMEEFPGGYQWNQKSGQYMKDFFAGRIHPYIFHMSWTLNKDNKVLYFQQMGEWYVKQGCIQAKRNQILGLAADAVPNDPDLTMRCCSAEPLFSCHYRDKPSVKPCKTSPNIDPGKPSFW